MREGLPRQDSPGVQVDVGKNKLRHCSSSFCFPPTQHDRTKAPHDHFVRGNLSMALQMNDRICTSSENQQHCRKNHLHLSGVSLTVWLCRRINHNRFYSHLCIAMSRTCRIVCPYGLCVPWVRHHIVPHAHVFFCVVSVFVRSLS